MTNHLFLNKFCMECGSNNLDATVSLQKLENLEIIKEYYSCLDCNATWEINYKKGEPSNG